MAVAAFSLLQAETGIRRAGISALNDNFMAFLGDTHNNFWTEYTGVQTAVDGVFQHICQDCHQVDVADSQVFRSFYFHFHTDAPASGEPCIGG